MSKSENEKSVSIKIFDNNDWQPDMEFCVELYDPNSTDMARFDGDDTKCRVTILDEDFPGKISFDVT